MTQCGRCGRTWRETRGGVERPWEYPHPVGCPAVAAIRGRLKDADGFTVFKADGKTPVWGDIPVCPLKNMGDGHE